MRNAQKDDSDNDSDSRWTHEGERQVGRGAYSLRILHECCYCLISIYSNDLEINRKMSPSFRGLHFVHSRIVQRI